MSTSNFQWRHDGLGCINDYVEMLPEHHADKGVCAAGGEIKEKKREEFSHRAKVLLSFFGIKPLLGLLCRAESCPLRGGVRAPRPTFSRKRGRRGGIYPSRDVYGIRGASGTPPPTLAEYYANPSKMTFSSAQMSSCEALNQLPVGRHMALYKMPSCAK